MRRLPDDYCHTVLGIHIGALNHLYPPAEELCIVTTKPRETDLSSHSPRKTKNIISLKKAVELIYNGKWYGPCDVKAFEEVKGG